MEIEEIKACPFCGGKAWIDDLDREYYWVSCEDCESDGPIKKTRQEAIAAWNVAWNAFDAAREENTRLREVLKLARTEKVIDQALSRTEKEEHG